MRRVVLALVSMSLFGASVFVGITAARLVTQQQGLDALVLGSAMFQVVIGGTPAPCHSRPWVCAPALPVRSRLRSR